MDATGTGSPPRTPVPATAAEAVRRTLLVRALTVLWGAAWALGALFLVLFRLGRPVEGGLAPLVVAGAVGLGVLIGGALVIEAAGRRGRSAPSVDQTAVGYVNGCALAGGMNAAAGLLTLAVVAINGVSSGLWLPGLLVIVLNLAGLLVSVPRMRELRRLHQGPPLPYVRV